MLLARRAPASCPSEGSACSLQDRLRPRVPKIGGHDYRLASLWHSVSCKATVSWSISAI